MALSGEVLLICRASCISNRYFIHPKTVPHTARPTRRRAYESRPSCERDLAGMLQRQQEITRARRSRNPEFVTSKTPESGLEIRADTGRQYPMTHRQYACRYRAGSRMPSTRSRMLASGAYTGHSALSVWPSRSVRFAGFGVSPTDSFGDPFRIRCLFARPGFPCPQHDEGTPNVAHMSDSNPLAVTDVRPFVPAEDFQRSHVFYSALGWSTLWTDGEGLGRAGDVRVGSMRSAPSFHSARVVNQQSRDPPLLARAARKCRSARSRREIDVGSNTR